LPYDDLNEGASGAVRYCLAAMRPVIITKSSIFQELENVGYMIEDNAPNLIAEGVRRLMGDKDEYDSQLSRAKEFIRKYSWESQSRAYLLLLAK
jgi:glycosyltransferase involved in cell wall biosynthesis